MLKYKNNIFEKSLSAFAPLDPAPLRSSAFLAISKKLVLSLFIFFLSHFISKKNLNLIFFIVLLSFLVFKSEKSNANMTETSSYRCNFD